MLPTYDKRVYDYFVFQVNGHVNPQSIAPIEFCLSEEFRLSIHNSVVIKTCLVTK